MIWEWMMWIRSSSLPGWSGDPVGYVASGLVLLAFTMRSMRSPRIAAIASNFAFIYYAIIAGMTPILILHAILLPMNVVRLVQIEGYAQDFHPAGTVKIVLALVVFVTLASSISVWAHPAAYSAVLMMDWPAGSI